MSSIPTGSYNLSSFSSVNIPELLGQRFDGEILFRTLCSEVSHSLYIAVYLSHLVQVESSLMIDEQDIYI